jgi:hypothetical protein
MAVSPTVKINVSGARGESFADVMRRTGLQGTLPIDSDDKALENFAHEVVEANPGFQGDKGDPGGNVMAVGLFTDVASMVIPNGTGKITTTGYRLTGWGQASYTLWKAPKADLPAFGEGKWWVKSNGGAKSWYLDPEGDCHFDMLGAWGDNQHDDFAAFQALRDFARWRGGYQPGDTYCMGGVFRFRPALYYSSATWQLNETVHLLGPSSGQSGGSSANRNWGIRFGDCTGIIVNRFNTLDGAVQNSVVCGGDGSIISGLTLVGTGFNRPGIYHGVQCHARAVVEGNNIIGFSGDLVRAVSNDLGGNVNGMMIWRNLLQGAGRAGYWIQGGDGNAGIIGANDIVNCGDWGFVIKAFLANTHIGDQMARCGTVGVGGRTVPGACSYAGANWQVMDGQDAAASNTQPGTNAAVWAQVSGNGSANYIYPTWAPGMQWKAGGAFLATGENAPNVILGLYIEPDCGPSQTSGLGLLMGGQSMAEGGYATVGVIMGRFGSTRGLSALARSLSNGSAAYQATYVGSRRYGDNTILQDTHTLLSPGGFGLSYDADSNVLVGHTSSPAFFITGPNTTVTAGRSTAQRYKPLIASLMLGSGPSARSITYSSTLPPTSGEYAKGDIVFNSAASAGGPPGMQCTTGGTAGSTAVFKALASVAA